MHRNWEQCRIHFAPLRRSDFPRVSISSVTRRNDIWDMMTFWNNRFHTLFHFRDLRNILFGISRVYSRVFALGWWAKINELSTYAMHEL